jgi:hypothetical protein
VLDAVQYALTKSGPRPTPRDGTRAGRIEAFGVTATFSSRATLKGTLEVEALSGKLDLGDLIDPGYEDPSIADKHRIRKLIDLSGAQADAEQFCGLVGATVSPRDVPTDLIDAADWAKRELQERARQAEDQATQHKAAANAAREAAAGVDLSAPCDDRELSAAMEQAIREQSRLTAQAAAGQKARRDAAEARQRAQEMTDDVTVEVANDAAAAAMDAYAKACSATRTAKEAWQKAQVDERLAEQEAVSTANVVAGIAKRTELRKQLESVIATGEQAEVPTDLQIADAAQVVANARHNLQQAALVRNARGQLDAAKTREADAASAAKRAESLRSRAASTDDMLAAELQRIGCPWRPKDVPVGKGTERRLVTRHKRGDETLVGDLSTGERARDAIDVALGLSGKSNRPSVLILRQEVWEGLQPAVQSEIDQHATQRGVVILTARATDDPEVTGCTAPSAKSEA